MVDSRNRPSTESLLRAVDQCLRRYVKEKQSVAVGYSGGLDSTVLLHVVNHVAKTLGFDFSALHVHHGLNSKADLWENSCVQVCRQLEIPLVVQHVNVPLHSGEGIEASARRLRQTIYMENPSDWILLAHHADDQAETILHNLIRGAGVRGAASIPEAHGRILRPVLGHARRDLLAYANAHQLNWIEDESNSDRRFTRNYLRHEVLPVISSRFPRASEQLAAAASRFGEADTLLNELAALDLRGGPPEFPLALNYFRDLPEARARNLLRAMLAWHHVQAPDERRLKEFVRQLQTSDSDRHPRIDLERYSLRCKGNKLYFDSLV